MKHTAQAAAVTGACVATRVVGAGGGAAVSGPAAPIGTLIGALIGSIIGGIGMGLVSGELSTKAFGKYFPHPKMPEQERMVREALKFFHFKPEDVADRTKFNKKTVHAKFRTFSRVV